MFNIFDHKGNANQNHNEIPFHKIKISIIRKTKGMAQVVEALTSNPSTIKRIENKGLEVWFKW
jgi:hypothetical protein